MELLYKTKTKTKTNLRKWNFFDGCSRNHFCCLTDSVFKCLPDPTGKSSASSACGGTPVSTPDGMQSNLWIGYAGVDQEEYIGDICMSCPNKKNKSFDINAYNGNGISIFKLAKSTCGSDLLSPILPDTCENKINNKVLTIDTDGNIGCGANSDIFCRFNNDSVGKRIWNCKGTSGLTPSWGSDLKIVKGISGQTCITICNDKKYICAMGTDKSNNVLTCEDVLVDTDASKCHCIPPPTPPPPPPPPTPTPALCGPFGTDDEFDPYTRSLGYICKSSSNILSKDNNNFISLTTPDPDMITPSGLTDCNTQLRKLLPYGPTGDSYVFNIDVCADTNCQPYVACPPNTWDDLSGCPLNMSHYNSVFSCTDKTNPYLYYVIDGKLTDECHKVGNACQYKRRYTGQ